MCVRPWDEFANGTRAATIAYLAFVLHRSTQSTFYQDATIDESFHLPWQTIDAACALPGRGAEEAEERWAAWLDVVPEVSLADEVAADENDDTVES